MVRGMFAQGPEPGAPADIISMSPRTGTSFVGDLYLSQKGAIWTY
jgi:hypothetical protein